MKLEYRISITQQELLDIKKNAAEEIIAKLSDSNITGNLRSSLVCIEKDGKILILKGLDIIAEI